MLQKLLCLLVIFTFSGCSVFDQFEDTYSQRFSEHDVVNISELQSDALKNALLIRALKHASDGQFFRVVERVGLDNLTKERQLIRSAREQMPDDGTSKKVPPLLFAGVLLEGAVIAYDTNLATGGTGARYLGIGKSAQYRQDNITVSLRMVSVATGEILIEVLSQKTVFSYANESTTIALMKAIEGAVVELINTGYQRRFWTHEKLT